MGKHTFLCFIDYKKAFDAVNRDLLMFKLLRIGINGNMYDAINSLYSNPRSRVILQDYKTDYFDCSMGVKQGDCLSPTLFSVFINDLAQQIKDSKIGVELSLNEVGAANSLVLSILLYADDVVLFSENENDMQELLFVVQTWCQS